jgi:hypothetical protein
VVVSTTNLACYATVVGIYVALATLCFWGAGRDSSSCSVSAGSGDHGGVVGALVHLCRTPMTAATALAVRELPTSG